MKNHSIYDTLLSKELSFNVGIIVIFSIVIIALIFSSIKFFGSKKLSIISAVMGLVIIIGIYWFCINPYRVDVKDQAYDTYRGEFYVSEYTISNRGGEYIYIQTLNNSSISRYKVICDADGIKNNTTYYGYFVVAKNSKALVDIYFED